MGQQVKLEKEAIAKRNELALKNDFSKNGEEYSSLHDTALTHNDDKHALGKGSGHGGHTYATPGVSKTMINRDQFDTENGGGAYDIHGRNNVGGRNYLKKISIYNQDRQYGINSIDMSANIKDGQYRN
jgi:hypothetical protein